MNKRHQQQQPKVIAITATKTQTDIMTLFGMACALCGLASISVILLF